MIGVMESTPQFSASTEAAIATAARLRAAYRSDLIEGVADVEEALRGLNDINQLATNLEDQWLAGTVLLTIALDALHLLKVQLRDRLPVLPSPAQ
jgi:hypothetical protein